MIQRLLNYSAWRTPRPRRRITLLDSPTPDKRDAPPKIPQGNGLDRKFRKNKRPLSQSPASHWIGSGITFILRCLFILKCYLYG